MKGFGARLRSQVRRDGDKEGKAAGASFGKLYGAAAAVAITGLVGAAIKKSLDNEVATDRLAASLGASPAQQKALGATAGRLFAQAYGQNMGEVTDAVGAVRSSFRSLGTGKDLERVSRQALDFANIFQTDVPTAISVASTVVKSELAKGPSQALDLLTAASQKVPTALRGDLLDAAEEYSGFFKTLGFNGEQTFSLLVEGSKKGIYGIDKMGDAVKEFTIRSTDMSTASKDAYSLIGLDARTTANAILAGGKSARTATKDVLNGLLSLKPGAKQANAAIALFGTPLEDLNVRDIPAFLKGLRDGQKGLGKFRGSIDRAGKTVNDNASTNLESFKRQVTTTFVNLVGGKVLPGLSKLASFLATTVGPKVQQLARDFAEGNGLAGSVRKVVDSVSKNLVPVVAAAAVTFQTKVLPAISTLASYLGAKLGPVLSDVAKFLGGTVIPLLGDLYGWFYTKVVPAVVRLATSIGRKLRPVFDQLAETFRRDILPTLQKVLEKFRENQPAIQKIVNFLGKWIGTLLKLAATVLGKVLPPVIRFVGFMFKNVAPAIATVIGWVIKIVGKFAEFSGKIVDAAKGVGRFQEVLRRKVGEALDYLGKLPGRIVSAVGSFQSTLYNAGRELIDGLIRGITKKFDDLKGTVSGIADKIKGYFPGSPVKEGPLRSFNKGAVGRKLMEMILEGIKKGEGPLLRRIARAAKQVAAAFDQKRINAETRRNWERFLNKLGSDYERLNTRITKANTRLQNLLKSRRDLMRSTAQSIRSEFNLGDLASGTNEFGFSNLTFDNISKTVKALVYRVRTFAVKLFKLRKAGFPSALISEVAALGSKDGLRVANTLLSGSREQRRGLIADLRELNAASIDVGAQVARSQYDRDILDARQRLRERREARRDFNDALKDLRVVVTVGMDRRTRARLYLEGEQNARELA